MSSCLSFLVCVYITALYFELPGKTEIINNYLLRSNSIDFVYYRSMCVCVCFVLRVNFVELETAQAFTVKIYDLCD